MTDKSKCIETIQNVWRVAECWANATLGFFYPEICQVCSKNRAGPAQSFLCSECREQVRWVRPPFCDLCGRPFEGNITETFECSQCREHRPEYDFARAAVLAQDPVLEVIRRYKYDKQMWFECFLGELLVEAAVAELSLDAWDLIIPVPLHPVKKRERGFNQAERLALRLSRATGLRMDSGLVRRILKTRTQTRLSREERLENVRGAFQVVPGERAKGRRVVLVDDVMTTGATTSTCAAALKRAGAAAVCVWTVARGN